ncbi:hypothetical protein T12_6630 [Trichinella patagoniensis]|uniref:Uncharacterized protein n=1 Tax=Trichinella patagoniensis TaxID=990121 RepID=A0A0V1A345_9BILA|nr:hypothetical protein T12_6630 [Trichinella patagoniensis]
MKKEFINTLHFSGYSTDFPAVSAYLSPAKFHWLLLCRVPLNIEKKLISQRELLNPTNSIPSKLCMF